MPSAATDPALETTQSSKLLCCRTGMYIPVLIELYTERQNGRGIEMDDAMTLYNSGMRPVVTVQILRYRLQR